MPKGIRNTTLLIAAYLLYAGLSNSIANACTVEKRGVYTGRDCYLLNTKPVVQLRLPRVNQVTKSLFQ